MHKILVTSLGNPLRGDDGVGHSVLEILSKNDAISSVVQFYDGSRCGLLSPILSGAFDWVIIIDAIDFNSRAGQWRWFSMDYLGRGDHEDIKTLHLPNLAQIVEIGRALQIALPTILILGVQPSSLHWGTQLSMPVQSSIHEICQEVIDQIRPIIS